MALVFANSGELLAVQGMLKTTSTPENLTLKLFKNDYTPTATSTAGDFTEADFTSYTAKTLSRGTWQSPSTVSGKATIAYYTAPQTWTCGATGNTIYGYYVGAGTLSKRHTPKANHRDVARAECAG
jgi:hypothetical protein